MKSLSKRVQECIELRSKLQQLGIDGFEELQPFVQAMNNYVRDGKRRGGLITMPSLDNRKFRYMLEDKEGVDSIVRITAK
ncbi:MAG: hypothetical protein EB060_12550, partial [Proteobacteria bacterium]|jgi:hypothetical protein|nr:hypothetical protein [Pseudomonadota bacterium]